MHKIPGFAFPTKAAASDLSWPAQIGGLLPQSCPVCMHWDLARKGVNLPRSVWIKEAGDTPERSGFSASTSLVTKCHFLSLYWWIYNHICRPLPMSPWLSRCPHVLCHGPFPLSLWGPKTTATSQFSGCLAAVQTFVGGLQVCRVCRVRHTERTPSKASDYWKDVSGGTELTRQLFKNTLYILRSPTQWRRALSNSSTSLPPFLITPVYTTTLLNWYWPILRSQGWLWSSCSILSADITGVDHHTEFSTATLPDRTNLESRHSSCCPCARFYSKSWNVLKFEASSLNI